MTILLITQMWLIATGSSIATPSLDPTTIFEIYGPLGVIAGLGLWLAIYTIRRLIAERDSEREYAKGLASAWQDKVLPLMVQMQVQSTSGTEALREATVVMRDVTVMMEILRRDGGYGLPPSPPPRRRKPTS